MRKAAGILIAVLIVSGAVLVYGEPPHSLQASALPPARKLAPPRGQGGEAVRDATGNCRMLWSRHHADADYTSTAISKPVARLIAGTGGEPAQVELIPLEGTGEPDWIFSGTKFCVAAAREADVFAALDYDETAQTVTVYKWHASSPVPDWSYTILSCTLVLPDKALVVSADGSTICVLVQKEANPIYSRMFCFDAETGPPPICTHSSPDVFMPLRIALSRYGDYIAYTAIDIESPIPRGRIFTITRDSCNNYWTGTVLPFAAGLAISPDGEYLAHDVFALLPPGVELVIRKWRDFLPGYYVECSHGQADYAPVAFACSWDFSTLVSGWASEDEPSKVKLFDMPDCDPLWTYNYPSNGEVPVDVALTTDGAYAAVGNWTDPDTNPEILVFEHASSQPIGTVDTPNDIDDVDMALAACGGAYVAAVDGDLHVVRVYEGVITVCPPDTIQDAIDAASNGYLVELCDDTFVGAGNRDIDFGGKEITVRSASGDPAACVIDCEGLGRGFSFYSGDGPCAVLEAVTITNGSGSNGGGIYCLPPSSPTIKGCVISLNQADHSGGGICARNGASPTITDSVFRGNQAGYNGGGVFMDASSSATITGCVISGNQADNDGGGIYTTNYAAPTITSCTITGNRAGSRGGGVCQLESDASLHPYAWRSIVWGNCADGGGEDGDQWYWEGTLEYCCCDVDESGVEGGPYHLGCPPQYQNIDEDPLFCDPELCGNAPTTAGDYHLCWASPCAPDQQPSCRLIGALNIGCVGVLGDLNCDCVVNAFDIDPFVLALIATPPGYPEYYAVYPDCDVMLADCNGDGEINAFDIDPFVTLLTGP